MRKIITAAILLLVVIISSYFIFIPSSFTSVIYKSVKCPSRALSRLYQSKDTLKLWWPGSKINDTTFALGNVKYTITNSNQYGMSFTAESNGISLEGSLSTIQFGPAFTSLKFEYDSLNSYSNPIARMKLYLKSSEIKKQINIILDSLKNYSENIKNIYGFEVLPEKIKDSSLITLKKTFNDPPTNDDVIGIINQLRKYINLNGGIEDDYPMLRIETAEDKKFEIMVAIPLKQDIPAIGDFTTRKMVLGNLMSAKIIGGPSTILIKQQLFEDYMKDHNITTVALPFQSLITDRQNKDTSKWVTILKYPVF